MIYGTLLIYDWLTGHQIRVLFHSPTLIKLLFLIFK